MVTIKCDTECIDLLFADPCDCVRHEPKPYRDLTCLILDCWQRIYDKRPYRRFQLHGKDYEEKMARLPDNYDFLKIIEFVKRRPNLRTFELIYAPIVDCLGPTLIFYLKRMKVISLMQVDITVATLEEMAKCGVAYDVEILRLSGNKFTMEHAEALREFLLKAKCLQYLDVGYCDLNNNTLPMVADGIINCPTLRAIDVSRLINCHHVHVTDSSKIASILAILLWRVPLLEVHYKHCYLQPHDMIPIAEYLSTPIDLVYLDLGSNGIGADGVRIIFNAIRKQSQLIGLDISENRIGPHGGDVIAHELPFTRIRYLDIGRNGITADIMLKILYTIKKSNQIRIFNVVGNEFDNDVGDIMRRQINARVLIIHTIDVIPTYEFDTNSFRIVPRMNDHANYNDRYHRVWPFYRRYDVDRHLNWHKNRPRKILVNGLYLDPIVVNDCGQLYEIGKSGELLKPRTDTKPLICRKRTTDIRCAYLDKDVNIVPETTSCN